MAHSRRENPLQLISIETGVRVADTLQPEKATAKSRQEPERALTNFAFGFEKIKPPQGDLAAPRGACLKRLIRSNHIRTCARALFGPSIRLEECKTMGGGGGGGGCPGDPPYKVKSNRTERKLNQEIAQKMGREAMA